MINAVSALFYIMGLINALLRDIAVCRSDRKVRKQLELEAKKRQLQTIEIALAERRRARAANSVPDILQQNDGFRRD